MKARPILAAVLTAMAALLVVAPSAAALPNVLVVVTDDQRAQGTMQVMPQTKSWVFDGGTDFSNAVVTTPLCCPSRASIFTGEYAHNHHVWHNGTASELSQLKYGRMMQRYLQSAGYATGIVGKYLNGWNIHDRPPNFNYSALDQGNYFNTKWSVNGSVRTVTRYSTRYAGDRATDFINGREAKDKKPWFLYLAPPAPHATIDDQGIRFEPEPQYADAPVGSLDDNPARDEDTVAELNDKPAFWRKIVEDFPPGSSGVPTAEETRAGQLRLLMTMDDVMGRVESTLQADGEAGNTLVVFTSDNGLFWGEHGDIPIKDMPWIDSISVPLAMRWPGHVPDHTTDTRTAANIDLAPTVLDAAGHAIPSFMDGRSLLRSWARPYVLAEYGGFKNAELTVPAWAGLYSPGQFQYDTYGSTPDSPAFREYYDLSTDPFEIDNLLANNDPSDDPDTSQLDAQLTSALRCSGANCP